MTVILAAVKIRISLTWQAAPQTWWFLVEAATLTFFGGLIGVFAGLGFGEVVKQAFGFTSDVPVWSAVVASAVSIGIGLVFGLVPANRAAGMDPVEALRHE